MGFNPGISRVSDLSDAFINNPLTDQPLAWDSSLSRWRNNNRGLGFNLTSIKRAAYTAAPNDFVIVDTETNGQSFDITLPNAPADNTRIAFRLFRAADNINVTIRTSGDDYIDTVVSYGGTPPPNYPVQGGVQWLNFSLPGESAIFQYQAATKYWFMLTMNDNRAMYLKTRAGFAEIDIVPDAYQKAIDAPKNSIRKTANYTLSLSDTSKIIDVDSSSTVNITIPNALTALFAANSTIEIVQKGTGQVVVTPSVGVTLHGAAGFKTRAQWSLVSLRLIPAYTASFPLSNMAMRFKADDITGANGSVVSSWPESSGNGLPAATQATPVNRPTLNADGMNGHKTVEFGASGNTFLNLSGTALDILKNKASINVFIAFKMPSNLTGSGSMFMLSTGSSNSDVRFEAGRYMGTSVETTVRRLDADVAFTTTHGPINTTTTGGLLSAKQLYANQASANYYNGRETSSTTSSTPDGMNTSNTTSLSGTIGSSGASASGWWQGGIAEILIYDRDLSISEKSAVYTYFQTTYGITIDPAGFSSNEWMLSGDTIV